MTVKASRCQHCGFARALGSCGCVGLRLSCDSLRCSFLCVCLPLFAIPGTWAVSVDVTDDHRDVAILVSLVGTLHNCVSVFPPCLSLSCSRMSSFFPLVLSRGKVGRDRRIRCNGCTDRVDRGGEESLGKNDGRDRPFAGSRCALPPSCPHLCSEPHPPPECVQELWRLVSSCFFYLLGGA